MKTINLTDEQFDTLYEFVDNKVESIVNASVDYNDGDYDMDDLFYDHHFVGITEEETEPVNYYQGA